MTGVPQPYHHIQGVVNKILTYSIVDGPGNRLVVFLQGCNFDCAACHNPYTIGTCDDCGDCVPACHAGALTIIKGQVAYDPATCDDCDDCLNICPISASPMVQNISVGDVLKIARQHRAFLSGITVSGGEATQQLDFVIALFSAIKAAPDLKDLTCFVDTNGHLSAGGWQALLPVTDGVMLDLKGFDPGLHAGLTGLGHAFVHAAARDLFKAEKLHEFRFLAIPGKTDTAGEIGALIDFLTPFGHDIRLRLNAFQQHGVRGAARQWNSMDKPGIDRIKARLNAAGFMNISTPALYQG